MQGIWLISNAEVDSRTAGFQMKLEDVYPCPGASSVKHNAVLERFADHLRCSGKLLQ